MLLACLPSSLGPLHITYVQSLPRHASTSSVQACSMLSCGHLVRLLCDPTAPWQDFELCGHLVPKGARLQCSLGQTLLTDPRWATGCSDYSLVVQRQRP